jgi:hypothetical protein
MEMASSTDFELFEGTTDLSVTIMPIGQLTLGGTVVSGSAPTTTLEVAPQADFTTLAQKFSIVIETQWGSQTHLQIVARFQVWPRPLPAVQQLKTRLG